MVAINIIISSIHCINQFVDTSRLDGPRCLIELPHFLPLDSMLSMLKLRLLLINCSHDFVKFQTITNLMRQDPSS